MIYFKMFNDNYGHAAGDEVLKETARQLKNIFPDSYCYRYGGDEFVVISTKDEKKYEDEVYSFTVPAVSGQTIQLSIGSEDGTPENSDQVFRMINNADRKLYILKEKTHKKP